MATSKRIAKVLYADSERCADMLYLSGLFVPDAFLAMDTGEARFGVLHALEIARARKDSRFDEVLSLEEVMTEARQRFRRKQASVADMIRYLMESLSIRELLLPRDFPAAIAFELHRAKVSFSFAKGALYPERERKREAELVQIRKGNDASAAGIRTAERILRAATIHEGYIVHEGRRLTSERLRACIEAACLERGAMPAHTIVAGGDQACDPHFAGSGPLRANSLIIVDVFPRLSASGYYGDLTRTFLKGRASEAQRRLVNAVRKSQRRALATIRSGVSARSVHGAVTDFFKQEGYETGVRDGVPEGFFHSTGHGLGLDIHEAPRLSPLGPKLESGMVVTVEPGLYYPGLGGCRIEDVVCVEDDGCRFLSNLHYRWHIR